MSLIRRNKSLLFVLVTTLIFTNGISSFAQDKKEKKNKTGKKEKRFSIRDTLDGAFDMSGLLADPLGVMPIPIIITQPAIGYGGGLALLNIKKQKKTYDVPVPPNISGVAGFGTNNKTWGAAVFHFHVWGPDKIRYIGAVVKPSINIKYYGNNSSFLSNNPVQFNLDSWMVYQRALVRIGTTDIFAGGAYIFFQGKTSFNEFTDKPIIDKILKKLEGKSTVSMLKPMVSWDSRDNIFTPDNGINAGVSLAYNATWLGGDENYYTFNPFFLGYKKIANRLFSGWRFDSDFMLGDSPFYAKPFIQMRGVPSMKYQSDNTMVVETEWKYNVYKRWSLDVFTGTGKAFQSFSKFGPATWVYNYGIGFRYKIARSFGVDAGVDFAWSNDDFAFSIVFGSAWNK